MLDRYNHLSIVVFDELFLDSTNRQFRGSLQAVIVGKRKFIWHRPLQRIRLWGIHLVVNPQIPFGNNLRFGKGLRIAWGSGTILPTSGRCATPLPEGWNCRCVAEITRMSLFSTVISTLEYTEVSLFWTGGSGRYPRKKTYITCNKYQTHPPHFKPTKVCIFSSSFVIQQKSNSNWF